MFGQSTQTTTASGGLFGGGAASASSATGGSGTGFFSGLGGKPSAENANKNVFGSTTFTQNSSSSTASAGLLKLYLPADMDLSNPKYSRTVT